MSKPRAVFIGRWCPFHYGHIKIMEDKIENDIPLLVMIRDTEYDEIPAKDRDIIIRKYFVNRGVDAQTLIIPDIESINYGRGVGYEINEIEVPSDIKNISATYIRNCIKDRNDDWKQYVPLETIAYYENE